MGVDPHVAVDALPIGADRIMISDIRHLLLADWDPIGIRALAGPEDEYDDYVSAVARLVTERASADALAQYLLRIEAEWMCLAPHPERARRVAEKLIALRG